jgi:hypothetical protein
VPKTTKFLKDCPNDGKEYFCRKIYQSGKHFLKVLIKAIKNFTPNQ